MVTVVMLGERRVRDAEKQAKKYQCD